MADKISAKVGEYTNSNGETKGRWVNIGVIMSNANGQYVLLDPSVSLAGVLQQQNRFNHSQGKKPGDRIMCSVFSDDRQGGSQGGYGGQQSGGYGGAPAGGIDGDEAPF